MGLKDRLVQSGPAPTVDRDIASQTVMSRAGKDSIKRNIHYLLIDELGADLDGIDGDDREVRDRIERTLRGLLDQESTPLSSEDRREITIDVMDNVLGYGPIQPFLEDAEITEVMVNDPDTIYVERFGKIHPTSRRFIDEAHLLRIIDKIVGQVGRRIDEASPMVDARLPDGSRVNAIVHPLAINGPMLTIRKFSHEPFTAQDLLRFGTISQRFATFIEACVRGKMNILISGGTGTGKTTLLNVVSSYIPTDERIVTIEDAAELRLNQEHVLRLESRPPNIEGVGQVTIRDLVRNSLRMRPDRIVVGEVRGAEAIDMLQAMNTGHEGSLSTVHANSPRDALARVETMVLMSGFDLPVRAIREQMSSALNLLVHLARLQDGSRRVVKVSEVEGMEGDTIILQDVFYFDHVADHDDQGRPVGRMKSTGLRPKLADSLEAQGIQLPNDLFAHEPSAGS